MLLKKLFGLCLFCISLQVYAKVKSFKGTHSGIYLGGGTQFFLDSISKKFDPVPSLAGTGVTVKDSDNTYLIPGRLGYFYDTENAGYDVYLRTLFNSSYNWSTTGAQEGGGKSTYRGYGAGAQGTFQIANSERLRIGANMLAEFLYTTLAMTFSGTNTGAQDLSIIATTFQVGPGISPEVYLGDQWSLKLDINYLYALPSYWMAAKKQAFMGRERAVGILKNPATGESITAGFGGLTIVGHLKLMFY